MKNLKEKLTAFLRNEKVKNFPKRVLNKRTFVTAIVILIIVAALKISFSLMFEIEGTVKNIDGKNITVVNFITTKTVDVGDYPIESKQIKVGDKIEITKNINGDILDIRDRENSHMDRKDGKSDFGKQKANESGKGDRKEKN
ncbi:hypothetical protein [uncultured Clostridium sp.]|uniref:hypothetical protein n=1 Tax=uncultured Clostridium sp. TaxID=59620 RepID=UPI0028E1970D|nr:hypothetical protein [uncultured Clostridium sp.]